MARQFTITFCSATRRHCEMSFAEDFVGRYNSGKRDNFEEYMKECGVGFLVRKAAANLSCTLEIKIQGTKWSYAQETTLKNSLLEFELDNEFEETTADGRKYRTIVTLTPEGKIIQRQKAIKDGEKDCVITRHMEDEDTLVVILECGNVTARQEYTRQK